MQKGTLYLFPNTLGGDRIDDILPVANASMISTIAHFIVESEKSAKALLRKLQYPLRFEEAEFYLLNEHTTTIDYKEYLKPLEEGKDIGLISDAGCPGVADPGADIVREAHRKGYKVRPLVGPSSILLSLMGSGFNGQSFTFHGYLPYEKPVRQKKILEMERTAKAKHTHLFIEAPYRNKALLEELVQICHGDTLICVACDITLPSELIQTKRAVDWKSKMPDIQKRPCIFLIGS
jgi:16S rRNA (cytidine1402-2'-O)-methyltransferase